MTDIGQVEDRKPQPSIRRFAGIIAVFVVFGPPVGALAVTLLLAALGLSSGLAAEGWLDQGRFAVGVMLLGLVFGLPISYIVGAVPAALVGLATAAWDARTGSISLYVALGAALALGVLAALRPASLISASEGESAAQVAIPLAHLSAAGLCWLLARTIFGRPEVSSTSGMGKNQ
jgi:hypothetical protein